MDSPFFDQGDRDPVNPP